MSAELHPQEFRLVVRGSTGMLIPTMDYERQKIAAALLGPSYSHALHVQTSRQMALLRIPEKASVEFLVRASSLSHPTGNPKP